MSEHDGEDRPRPRWAHRSPRRASEEQDVAYTPPEPVGAALERLVRHLGWGPRTATVGVIAKPGSSSSSQTQTAASPSAPPTPSRV